MRTSAFVQWLFHEFRKGENVRQLTEVEVKKLLEQYFYKAFREDEIDRIMQESPLNVVTHEEEKAGYGYLRDCLKEYLADYLAKHDCRKRNNCEGKTIYVKQYQPLSAVQITGKHVTESTGILLVKMQETLFQWNQ